MKYEKEEKKNSDVERHSLYTKVSKNEHKKRENTIKINEIIEIKKLRNKNLNHIQT